MEETSGKGLASHKLFIIIILSVFSFKLNWLARKQRDHAKLPK